MKHLILKVLALTSFSLLIISFVAYKSGFIGGHPWSYSLSPNGGALNNKKDTLDKKEIEKRLMMSSSKVLIIRKEEPKKPDTSKTNTDSINEHELYFPSSKVGRILKPGELRAIQIDSTTKDSLKK